MRHEHAMGFMTGALVSMVHIHTQSIFLAVLAFAFGFVLTLASVQDPA